MRICPVTGLEWKSPGRWRYALAAGCNDCSRLARLSASGVHPGRRPRRRLARSVGRMHRQFAAGCNRADAAIREHRKFRLRSGSSPEYGCYVKPQRGAPRWGLRSVPRPPTRARVLRSSSRVRSGWVSRRNRRGSWPARGSSGSWLRLNYSSCSTRRALPICSTRPSRIPRSPRSRP